MRTTLTLDDDVAAAIQRLMRLRGGSLKDTVNATLRKGLEVLERGSGPAPKPFRVTPWNLGGALVGSLDNIEEVLSRVEGEEHR